MLGLSQIAPLAVRMARGVILEYYQPWNQAVIIWMRLVPHCSGGVEHLDTLEC